MKIFFTCLVASLAISASSLAQTSTGTTTKGTMTVYVTIPGTSTGSTDASTTSATTTTSGTKGSTIISGITVMATSTGQVQYAIEPNGITYTDPMTPQTVSTHDIYDAIAAQAVTDGVARGYHPVSSTSGATTKVYDASSTVHEFSIKYDQSTNTPVVTETKESVVTSTVQ